jgi:hypothetical protein
VSTHADLPALNGRHQRVRPRRSSSKSDNFGITGQAPTRVVAAHITAVTVDRTRPLCPYPQVARYGGTGSTNEAENFTCRLT